MQKVDFAPDFDHVAELRGFVFWFCLFCCWTRGLVTCACLVISNTHILWNNYSTFILWLGDHFQNVILFFTSYVFMVSDIDDSAQRLSITVDIYRPQNIKNSSLNYLPAARHLAVILRWLRCLLRIDVARGVRGHSPKKYLAYLVFLSFEGGVPNCC